MGFKIWRQSRWCKLVFLTGLAGALGFNGFAWMHARAMTHYVEGGLRTEKPEQLSFNAKVWAVATGVKIPRPHNHLTPKDVGLSYETIRIAAPKGENLEAWWVRASQSQGAISSGTAQTAIAMFPPHAASKDSLLAPAAAFHKMGYDVLLVDFRGEGGSSGSDTSIGLREADDVALSVSHLQQTWPGHPIVLYGMSMGAVAIMRAIAVEGVRPAGTILENPFDRLLNTVRHRFQAMGLPTFPGAEAIVFWGGVQQGFNGFAHNPVEYAKAIKCPTLMLHGAHDERVTMEEATRIYENLLGRKQLVSFPEAGHDLLITADPNQWKQCVAKFLSALVKDKS